MEMKAKFVTAIIVTILLASMVSMVFVPSAMAHTECNPFITNLIAGQHTDVGDVLVWNDINYLYVKYVTTDDWYLTEIHLHIATSMEDIPQMNGNPIPGHFDYVEEGLWTQEYLFEIPLTWDPCTDVKIAAHAVVQRIVETCIDFESFQEKDEVSSVSTPKGDVEFYMTSKAPLVPLVVGQEADLTPTGSYPMVAAPDTSPPYENIVAFTVVYPGNPYRDDYVKDDGGTGAGGKTLTDPQDLSQIPLLYHAYAQGLAIVIDVSGVEAVQGLDLAAIDLDWTEVWYFLYFDENHELMDKTQLGPPAGQSGDGVAYAVEYPNPVSKVAIWGGMNLGQEDRIGYAIDNICVASLEEETAWGDGCGFPGKNWATYFCYHVQGVEMPEVWPEGGTLSVAYEDLPIGGGNDWDYNDFVVDIDTLATFWGTSTDRKLIQIDFTVRPEAKVAGYTHVMHLDADVFTCDGTYELYRDGSLVASGAYDHSTGIDVVLVPNTGSPPSEVILTIYFDPGCEFSFPTWDHNLYHGENLFYDPYLYVIDTGQDIHTGDVRMLTVPVDWTWPMPDGNAIWNIYPKVTAGTPPTFVPYWWTP